MSQGSPADGVRFERVGTSRDLERILGALSTRLRFDIARDLDERGEALRLDPQTQRVHHLRCDDDEIVIATWGPMSTLFEAAILLSALKTLPGFLDEETAVRLYRQATFREEFPAEPRRTPVATPKPSPAERLRPLLIAAARLWRALGIAPSVGRGDAGLSVRPAEQPAAYR